MGPLLAALSGSTGIFDLIKTGLDKIFPDPQEKAQAQVLIETIQNQLPLAQVEINKLEAANPNLFVSGARPFVTWVCGIGLCFSFIINPMIQWTTGASGPVLPIDVMYNLIVAILGMGALRTYEKVKGVSK